MSYPHHHPRPAVGGRGARASAPQRGVEDLVRETRLTPQI